MFDITQENVKFRSEICEGAGRVGRSISAIKSGEGTFC